MTENQKLREALQIAVRYIDMDALYISACSDHDAIKEAIAPPTEPEMPLSMNQFGRLVDLTREHLTDNTFVYKARSKTGDTCHFGVESAAKAWAKGGTVEAIKVREFKLHTSAPPAAPAGELPELPEHIGEIIGIRYTPEDTSEFWGYFADGFKTDKKQNVYTADQMRAYGEQCWKAGYKHGAWGDKPAVNQQLTTEPFDEWLKGQK